MGNPSKDRFDPQQAQEEMRAQHERALRRLAEADRRSAAAIRSRLASSSSAAASRRTSVGSSSDDSSGFLTGLATGVPIPLTPSAVAGAAIHSSIYDTSSSCSSSSSSYDSGSSYSSSDSGSSSSSCD